MTLTLLDVIMFSLINTFLNVFLIVLVIVVVRRHIRRVETYLQDTQPIAVQLLNEVRTIRELIVIEVEERHNGDAQRKSG